MSERRLWWTPFSERHTERQTGVWTEGETGWTLHMKRMKTCIVPLQPLSWPYDPLRLQPILLQGATKETMPPKQCDFLTFFRNWLYDSFSRLTPILSPCSLLPSVLLSFTAFSWIQAFVQAFRCYSTECSSESATVAPPVFLPSRVQLRIVQPQGVDPNLHFLNTLACLLQKPVESVVER